MMDKYEFGKACQPLNILYKKMFGVIPSPADYACTRERFLEALKRSIDNHMEICNFLKLATIPDDDIYSF